MSENTPATSDGDDGADGDRDVGAAHRGAVTSGTAPAVGRGRAAASAQDTEAARRAARATDRRGALFGLLTAGAAVVAGTAVGGGGEWDAGTEPVPATGRTVQATVGVEGMRFVPDTVDVAPGDRLTTSRSPARAAPASGRTINSSNRAVLAQGLRSW